MIILQKSETDFFSLSRGHLTQQTSNMPMPTELRMWLKEQMRAIENKTLDDDKTDKILTMLEEWKHTGHAKEVCEIINELKAEKKKKSRRGGKKHKNNYGGTPSSSTSGLNPE